MCHFLFFCGYLIVHKRTMPLGPGDISQTPSEGPIRPRISFPVKEQDCNRSFHTSWYKKYRWIEYSQVSDAVFCFCCRHFSTPTANVEEVFTSCGFSNWRASHRRLSLLDLNVYRKPTHTDKYLNFDSHHPICKKARNENLVHES